MKHKTIICTPELFDEEFEKWKNSFTNNIRKLEITHNGNNHYIMYLIDETIYEDDDEY